jgi:hypothetical protein
MPFATALLAAEDERDVTLLIATLNGRCHPIEDIIGVRGYPVTEHVFDVLAHEVPIAGGRLDAEAAPQVPITGRYLADGIEGHATEKLPPGGTFPPPIRRTLGYRDRLRRLRVEYDGA